MQKKYLDLLLVILFGLSLSGCNKNNITDIKGRWEMFVGEDPSPAGKNMGITDLTYVLELNLEDRTFEPEADFDGRKSYGYMDFSNASRIYHFDIDSVFPLSDNCYRIVSFDSNRMISKTDTIRYDAKTEDIILGNNWVFKHISKTVEQQQKKNDNGFPYLRISIFLLISIVFLVLAYYLFKILMGYIAFALIFMLPGAAIAGIILWILIGGFDIDLHKWSIITILLVFTLPLGAYGILNAIKSTGEFIKMPFMSDIAKRAEEYERKRKVKIIDENGNETDAKISTGLMGEKSYNTSDGRTYEDDGTNKLNRIH